ncbi:MAG: hypothetical protein FWD34_08020 [Oscillospiraceae bacterium]|nr:hypothetical protein [Oscillospiraceae bacterium]
MKNEKIINAFDVIEPDERAKYRMLDNANARVPVKKPWKANIAVLSAACLTLIAGTALLWGITFREAVPAIDPRTEAEKSTNFTIHENTLDLDVRLLEIHGDEHYFNVLFEMKPTNDYIFDENENYLLLEHLKYDTYYPAYLSHSNELIHSDINPLSKDADRYVKDGILYFNIKIMTTDVIGEEFVLEFTRIGVYRYESKTEVPFFERFEPVMEGIFTATFTADYIPAKQNETIINEETIVKGFPVALEKISFSDYSVLIYYSFDEFNEEINSALCSRERYEVTFTDKVKISNSFTSIHFLHVVAENGEIVGLVIHFIHKEELIGEKVQSVIIDSKEYTIASEVQEHHSFRATVMSTNNNSLLVFTNDLYGGNGTLAHLSADGSYFAGQEIIVHYDGMVQELYPVIIPKIFKVEIDQPLTLMKTTLGEYLAVHTNEVFDTAVEKLLSDKTPLRLEYHYWFFQEEYSIAVTFTVDNDTEFTVNSHGWLKIGEDSMFFIGEEKALEFIGNF